MEINGLTFLISILVVVFVPPKIHWKIKSKKTIGVVCFLLIIIPVLAFNFFPDLLTLKARFWYAMFSIATISYIISCIKNF